MMKKETREASEGFKAKKFTKSFYVIYSQVNVLTRDKHFSFRFFFWDEFFCERQRGITYCPKWSPTVIKTPDTVSYEIIPKTAIRDLFDVPLRLEKMLLLGFAVCLECFLYELTIMPVQAFLAMCKLLRILIKWLSSRLLVNFSFRILRHSSDRLDMTSSHHGKSTKSFCVWRIFLVNGVRRWCNWIQKISRTRSDSKKDNQMRPGFASGESCGKNTLSLPQACDLTRTIILIVSLYSFNKLFDVAEIYHFIRAQSLMKLYVIFNMLEIFERLWRSLGRDALDSLMRQVVSLYVVESSLHIPKKIMPHSNYQTLQPLPDKGTLSILQSNNAASYFSDDKKPSSNESFNTRKKSPHKNYQGRGKVRNAVLLFNNPPTKKTPAFYNLLTSVIPGVMNKISCSTNGVSNFLYWKRCLFLNYYHPYFVSFFRLFLSIGLVLVYVVVHSLIHLLRALLFNISLNSSDSVIFLIVTSNNFAELKSTVFKKYSKVTLFSIVASDCVERFYLFLDGIIVFLRLATSVRTPITSFISIISWLTGMIALECLVDWVKHFFLLKLNFLPTKTFLLYREALWADILVSRQWNLEHYEDNIATQWKTPCKSCYSFPHVCSRAWFFPPFPFRRLGFVSLPLTALLVSFLLQFPWRGHFFIVTLTVTLLWSCLLMVKLILSIILVSLGIINQKYLTVQRDQELQNLSAL